MIVISTSFSIPQARTSKKRVAVALAVAGGPPATTMSLASAQARTAHKTKPISRKVNCPFFRVFGSLSALCREERRASAASSEHTVYRIMNRWSAGASAGQEGPSFQWPAVSSLLFLHGTGGKTNDRGAIINKTLLFTL